LSLLSECLLGYMSEQAIYMVNSFQFTSVLSDK